jgi:hypothetical protein
MRTLSREELVLVIVCGVLLGLASLFVIAASLL